MTAAFSIAVIPGDGIGQEVMPPALDVLEICSARFGFALDLVEYDWGSQRYRDTGQMMPDDGIALLDQHDSILFGAVGAPDIPDTATLWGLLIPIRRQLDQYINLRPVKHVPGVPSPLRDPAGIDIVIVRENVEGEYSEVGAHGGSGDSEYVTQESRFSRKGVERVARYAAELAGHRRGRLTSATKSNGILHTMPFWDSVVAEVLADYPAVTLRSELIDALAASIVRAPQSFDVIVASNLFGDILSDLTAACVGSMGLAASGNLNPEREHPSMFEPVHGSAPDISGRGVANPMAQISAAAMMLEHLGLEAAGAAVHAAVDAVLRDGVRSADLGGNASTAEVAAAVAARLVRDD